MAAWFRSAGHLKRLEVGFLFNHEGAHQVAHSVPTAMALSRLRPDWDVTLLHVSGESTTELERLAASYPGHRCILRSIAPTSRIGQLAEVLGRQVAAIGRVGLLRDNLDLFAELDALVVPEKTSVMLKTRFGLTGLKIIHTRHGAGDRAVGFDRASGEFDFVLLAGQKIQDRLQAAGLLHEGAYGIVGYPKFDTIEPRAEMPRLFGNDRPTVLYNPHSSPRQSSWYRMGRQVLEYFYRSTKYNLVFAPHVMLFKSRVAVSINPPGLGIVGDIDDKYRLCPHMLIDTGSEKSIDMSYTLAADLYLGDVSSQVYEFMVRPRSCVFLDAHRVAWENDPNYAQWQAGPVIRDIGHLDDALERAVALGPRYRAIQERLFAYTFDLTGRPSAERAALAIADYLDRSVGRAEAAG